MHLNNIEFQVFFLLIKLNKLCSGITYGILFRMEMKLMNLPKNKEYGVLSNYVNKKF